MSKLAGTAIALSLVLAAPAGARAMALGPEAHACSGGQPAVLVRAVDHDRRGARGSDNPGRPRSSRNAQTAARQGGAAVAAKQPFKTEKNDEDGDP